MHSTKGTVYADNTIKHRLFCLDFAISGEVNWGISIKKGENNSEMIRFPALLQCNRLITFVIVQYHFGNTSGVLNVCLWLSLLHLRKCLNTGELLSPGLLQVMRWAQTCRDEEGEGERDKEGAGAGEGEG